MIGKLDHSTRFIPPLISNYHRFAKFVLSISIPKGHRHEHIPGWIKEFKDLFNKFNMT